VGSSIGTQRTFQTVVAHEDELREVLTTSALFGDVAWEEAVLSDIIRELETVVVKGGEVVVRRGDPSDDLLLVVSGRLKVVLEAPETGSERVLAELGRGETVGEAGLITGDRRSATVYAIRDAILARLTRESFEALCRRQPKVMMERFAGGTLRRMLREARGEQLAPPGFRGSIALVSADPGVRLAGFTEDLTRHLGDLGATVVLTSSLGDAMLGRAGATTQALTAEDDANLVRWIGGHERSNRFVVYCPDPGATRWNALSIRQADHVLLVSRSSFPRQDTPESSSGGGTPRRTSVVLLHEDGVVRPGAAAAWNVGEGSNVYHVRRGVDEDASRLARLLAGEGVGLVIGGGGARAFAAAGVARALAEAGSPIDTVCGVSAGGMVAGLFAMGLSYEEVVSRCSRAARRIDYTVPVYALTTGKNWSATLEELFGDTQIEDLLLPFFCTSVNLTEAELVVHDRGSLLHAVRASTAIPGILPPVWHDGDLLVDGGLLNNLPIDLARAQVGVGRVLAVSVSPERQRTSQEPFGYYLSGWRALGARLARKAGGMPSAMDILMQSMLVADARTKRSTMQMADWIFQPPAGGYSLMDWRHFAQIAASGYEYASRVLLADDAREAILGGRA
jgi:NTE family protein